jgi:hypothetical protein
MDPAGLLQLPAQRFQGLNDIVRREVEGLLRARGADALLQGRSPDCPFSTIEAYLSLVISILPALAKRLQGGPLVENYIDEQIAELDANTDFSDLNPVTLVCEKEERLRSVRGSCFKPTCQRLLFFFFTDGPNKTVR